MRQKNEQVWPGEAVYCPACGAKLERTRVYGRERGVCLDCGRIEFRAPQLAAAVLLQDGSGRILLVERGPESTQPGKWSIPAGYVDYGEEIREAAARELLEETGLVATIGPPVYVATNFHDPAKVSVCVWFAGTITGGKPQAGSDASDVGWFAPDELPDLAFDTDSDLIARLQKPDNPGIGA
ncbi:MAG: NUDIX hydrolase [bacterium]|nr:NUDIX hydrolase [bacterium]MCY3652654.1 NUDIX hydrolase [bacterium]